MAAGVGRELLMCGCRSGQLRKGGGQEGMGWRVSGSQRVGVLLTQGEEGLSHTHTHTHTHTSDGLRAVASGKHFIKLNYFT